MRAAAIAAALLVLAGCEKIAEQQSHPDQCLRRQLFEACLAKVPQGPQATHFNDWSEVVSECGSQAYYLSIRSVQQISKECRP